MPSPLRKMLKANLTEKQLSLLPSSFDIVGDILIFADFPTELKNKEKLIAESLLKLHKNIRVVAKKTKKYSGRFRLPKIKIIAGGKSKETEHRENNIRLKLNVEKVYFSPRLSNERKRIASLVKPNESILVMFSGCAPYPCVIAKNSKPKEIYAVEINPTAHKYAVENVLLNKLSNIRLFLGDARSIVPKLKKRFDRIIMPLPKGAESFLGVALKASKKGSTIHFYDFLAEEELYRANGEVMLACKAAKKKCKPLNIVRCGQFSPRLFRICIDFKVQN